MDASNLGTPRIFKAVQNDVTTFFNSRLRHTIDAFKCDHYQKLKLPGKGYGLLSHRDVVSQPWYEIAVDLTGPWEVKVKK